MKDIKFLHNKSISFKYYKIILQWDDILKIELILKIKEEIKIII